MTWKNAYCWNLPEFSWTQFCMCKLLIRIICYIENIITDFFLSLFCFPRRNIFAWNKLHCLIRSLTFLKTQYDLQNVHRQKSTSTLLFICYEVDICLSIMAHIIEVRRSVDTEAYSVAHSTLHHKTVGLLTPWDDHTVRNWVSSLPLSVPRHYNFIDGICAALFSFIYMLKMKTVLVQLRSTVH